MNLQTYKNIKEHELNSLRSSLAQQLNAYKSHLSKQVYDFLYNQAMSIIKDGYKMIDIHYQNYLSSIESYQNLFEKAPLFRERMESRPKTSYNNAVNGTQKIVQSHINGLDIDFGIKVDFSEFLIK